MRAKVPQPEAPSAPPTAACTCNLWFDPKINGSKPVIGPFKRPGYDDVMKVLRRFLSISFCISALIAATPLAAQDKPDQATPPSPSDQSEPAPIPPPPGKKSPPDVSMEAYGTSNPQCLEWTDSCQTCARDSQNQAACSTPGIACLPGEVSCKAERK
jgi:hypothetical protein